MRETFVNLHAIEQTQLWGQSRVDGVGRLKFDSAQAIALTIEMGFLSLTFAASLKKQKHSVFLVSILLPPLSLWLGGFIGATTAAAVARAPAMHVALISFGIAALLFLVTEELLLEAHEAQEHSAHEEHIWWVDMFFFLGFLLSFLMDKLLDTD